MHSENLIYYAKVLPSFHHLFLSFSSPPRTSHIFFLIYPIWLVSVYSLCITFNYCFIIVNNAMQRLLLEGKSNLVTFFLYILACLSSWKCVGLSFYLVIIVNIISISPFYSWDNSNSYFSPELCTSTLL